MDTGGEGKHQAGGLSVLLIKQHTGTGRPLAAALAVAQAKELLYIKAPGVEKIHPEIWKALDIVRLSWLTHLFSTAWRSGTVPVWQQTLVVVGEFDHPVYVYCGLKTMFPRGHLWGEYVVVKVKNVFRGCWTLRIASLLFEDDVVMLVSSDQDLQ